MRTPETDPIPAPERSLVGIFAAAYVFVSLVAFSPVVQLQAWTPKAALLPLVVAVGLPMIVTLVHRREPAAIAAVVFLLAAATSTALSAHPAISTFGLYGWGTGLLFCFAIFSAWAIGRCLDVRGRRDVGVALLAGTVVNLSVSVAQRLYDLSSYRLQLSFGRSPGLLGNPVNLSGLASAGLAYAVVRWANAKPGWWLLAVAAGGSLMQLAGGRIAYLVVVGTLIWAAIRKGVRTMLLVLAATTAGFLLATPVAEQSGEAPAQRVAAGVAGEGVASRVESWASARHAVADAPVLGSGPGTYFPATTRHRSEEAGRIDGGDNVYADAHNLAVEYAVTTGILGMALLIAFGILASRGARGPMLAIAAALLVSHLVQPQNVAMTPLMFLALGAAHRDIAPLPSNIAARLAWWGLATAAIGVAALLLYADHQLRQSDLDFTISQSKAAERVLPKWKDPAALIARNYLFAAIEGGGVEEYFDEAERWRVISAEREPYDAQAWYRLGDLQLRRSKTTEAAASFQSALEVNPTSVFARVGLGHIALLDGDPEQAVKWWKEALPFVKDPRSITEIERLIESQST